MKTFLLPHVFIGLFGVVVSSPYSRPWALDLNSRAFAKGKTHAAHEHGNAQLNIVIEGQKVTAIFESPSESIVGFEHEAKKPKDVEKRNKEVAKFTTSISELFQFETKTGCKLALVKADPFVVEDEHEHKKAAKSQGKAQGTHSETHAQWEGQCSMSPSGTKLKLGFHEVFGGIQKLNVQILSGEKQFGKRIKNSSELIDL